MTEEDKLPSRLGSALAELETTNLAEQQLSVPFSDASRDLEVAVSRAVQSLRTAGAPELADDPTVLEMMGAVFRSSNTIGSALSSNSLWESLSPTEDSPELTPAKLIERVEKKGLYADFHRFWGVSTEAEFDAVASDLEREREDLRIRTASGWLGTAADVGAAILDPTTFIPGGAVAKGVRVGKALTGVSSATLEGALLGGTSMAAYEAGLQASQVTRDWDTSAQNIAAGTVLGSVVGFSLDKVLGGKISRNIEKRFDEMRATGGGEQIEVSSPLAVGSSTVGAAGVVNEFISLQNQNLQRAEELFSGGAFESKRALGELVSPLRNPAVELRNGATAAERNFINLLTNDPSVSDLDVVVASKGQARGSNVIDDFGQYVGGFADASHEINKLYHDNSRRRFMPDLGRQSTPMIQSREEFNRELSIALVNGDRHDNHVIAEAAKVIRKRVLDPIRKAHEENGTFVEEGQLRNAESYFPIVYDADQIKGTQDDFIATVGDAFAAQFAKELKDAQYIRDFRKAEIENARIENFGITRKVENPEGGYRTEVVKAGTLREARAEAQAEFSKESGLLTRDRDGELEAFDKNAPTTNPELEALFSRRDQVRAEKLNATHDVDSAVAVLKEEMVAAEKALRETELQTRPAAKDVNKSQVRSRAAKLEKEVARSNGVFETKIKKAKAEGQQAIDKLDGEIAGVRNNVKAHYETALSVAKEARDDAIEAAKEAAENAVLAAKGIELPEGVATTIRKYKNPRDLKDAARRAAQDVFDKATGVTRLTFEHEFANKVSRYTKARQNPTFHSVMLAKGWARSDALEVLEKYIHTAGLDASLGKHFRKPIIVDKVDAQTGAKVLDADGKVVKEEKLIADASLSEFKKEIAAEYASLRDADVLPDTLEQKLAEKFKDDADGLQLARTKELVTRRNKVDAQQARAFANIDAIMSLARGQTYVEGLQGAARVAEAFGLFNFVTKMGGNVISSAMDPINIVVANGFGKAMKHGILPILKDFKKNWLIADEDLRRLGRLSGSNTEMVFNSRVLEAVNGPGSVFSRTDSLHTLRRIGETFSKASGITYWNGAWKQIAYNVTQARIVENALKGWEKLSKSEQVWQTTIGLSKEDLERVAAAFKAQRIEDTLIARWDEWEPDIGEKFRKAVYSESFNNVITPRFDDKLAMHVNPVTRAIMQFRSHMFANQARLIGRNVQLATLDKQKAMGVYTGLFGIAMGGVLVDALKRVTSNGTITGNTRSDQSVLDQLIHDWETRPIQMAYSGLDRSGVLLPVMFELNNIAEKVTNVGVARIPARLMDEPIGDGTGRFRERSTLDAILGPSAALLQEAPRVVRSFTDVALDPEKEYGRADFRRAVKMLPFNNVPYVQAIINEGERQLGTVYDWPAPN